MSCDAAAAAALMLFASVSQPAEQGKLIRIADVAPAVAVTPPSVVFQKEPLFVDIVSRAGVLLGQVNVYRDALKADAGADLDAYLLFKQEVKRLSDLDFEAHKSLESRGLDSDLKCILRGISADLTLKMGDLDQAADGKSKDRALKELSYLLNDNVEVITAPPAPPV